MVVTCVMGQMDVDGGARSRGGGGRAGGTSRGGGGGGGEISRLQASVLLDTCDREGSASTRVRVLDEHVLSENFAK